MLIFFSKKNCMACKLVRDRLNEFKIQYSEVFDHAYSAPRLKDKRDGRILLPPITTSKLKKWLSLVRK